jgi:hypothetical protein
MNMLSLVEQLFTAKLVVVCLLMLHITAPHPDGLGAKNVMLNCLRDAGLKPTDVDNGTSTST